MLFDTLAGLSWPTYQSCQRKKWTSPCSLTANGPLSVWDQTTMQLEHKPMSFSRQRWYDLIYLYETQTWRIFSASLVTFEAATASRNVSAELPSKTTWQSSVQRKGHATKTTNFTYYCFLVSKKLTPLTLEANSSLSPPWQTSRMWGTSIFAGLAAETRIHPPL